MRVAPVVLWLAAAKLVLHLLVADRYGIYRDELHNLVCADHLDWGYVDYPPLIVVIAWVERALFGESLLGIRLLPALAGAALVWLSGVIARDLGGGRFAQGLAALAVLLAPVFLVEHHTLTINAFEPLAWTACLACVVRALAPGDPRWWVGAGAAIGIGFELKYAIAFLTAALVLALLLTPERRVLRGGWFWIGVGVGLLLFFPNLLWMARHGFPFFEFMHNVRGGHRDVIGGPPAFLAAQATMLGIVTLPLVLGGVAWLLRGRWRVLGIAYLIVLLELMLLKGKNFYLAPVYPMVLAAGAVWIEQATARPARIAYVALLVCAGLIVFPAVVPILSVDATARYLRTDALPDFVADQFGWEDVARETSRAYDSLPPEVRARTAIFANDYARAAAIDWFGPRYGLPRAISPHLTYFWWGPRDYDGSSVLVLGDERGEMTRRFREVSVVGRVSSPHARPDERYDILWCRGMNEDLRTAWPSLKRWL